MVQQHHSLNGHEFEQTPGDSEGQGILACCSPQNHRVGRDLVAEQQQGIHLQFCGWFVSLSVKPDLETVEAYFRGTVWSPRG